MKTLVEECIAYLLKVDTLPKGVFTWNSNMTLVKTIHDKFHDIGYALQSVKDACVVGSVLLFYLRELREPLFTFGLSAAIVKLNEENTMIDRLDHGVVRKLLKTLPPRKGVPLKQIFSYLHHISKNSMNEEYTSLGLANAFSPVLCKRKGSAYMSVRHISDLPPTKIFIQYLIDEFPLIFLHPPLHFHGTTSLHSHFDHLKLDHILSRIIHKTLHSQQISCNPTFMVWPSTTSKSIKSYIHLTHQLSHRIKSFESNFLAQHGHTPVHHERQPILIAQQQYKLFKYIIRDHASRKIQHILRTNSKRPLTLKRKYA